MAVLAKPPSAAESRTHTAIVRQRTPNNNAANFPVHGGLFCLSCTAREHQGTPKCAQIEEAATREMVLTALVRVKNVNTWFEGSL